jgi:hypothetical protein
MADAKAPLPPLTPASRLELANRLFREYYARCFWHWNPDRSLTEADIPALVRGLRTYGGHRGMREAARLVEEERSASHAPDADAEGRAAPPGPLS